jgi:hypothetical protein
VLKDLLGAPAYDLKKRIVKEEHLHFGIQNEHPVGDLLDQIQYDIRMKTLIVNHHYY